MFVGRDFRVLNTGLQNFAPRIDYRHMETHSSVQIPQNEGCSAQARQQQGSSSTGGKLQASTSHYEQIHLKVHHQPNVLRNNQAQKHLQHCFQKN